MKMGLEYNLAIAGFQNNFTPILTSITGIWASLFALKMLYPYIKDNSFINAVGQNTYHIMALNAWFIYLISTLLLFVNKLPESTRNNNMYWIYNPAHTVFIYFITVMIISTYSPILFKYLIKKIIKK